MKQLMNSYFTKVLSVLAFGVLFSTQLAADCVYEQVIEGENLQIGTMLTWSTAFEEDSKVFLIEKSEDGATFESIGNVDAAGESEDVKSYNFLDIMAKADRTYYRLKQIDTDGSFSYSDILTINRKFENNFMVARMSAVATQDIFELTLDSFVEGEMNYSVASIKGEVILEDRFALENGLNEITINLEDQKEGIYKLSLAYGDEAETIVLRKVADEIKSKPNVASTKKANRN